MMAWKSFDKNLKVGLAATSEDFIVFRPGESIGMLRSKLLSTAGLCHSHRLTSHLQPGCGEGRRGPGVRGGAGLGDLQSAGIL